MPEVVLRLSHRRAAPRRRPARRGASPSSRRRFESGFVNNKRARVRRPRHHEPAHRLPQRHRRHDDGDRPACPPSGRRTRRPAASSPRTAASEDYTELHPGKTAWYDEHHHHRPLEALSPMIALPFHPSNAVHDPRASSITPRRSCAQVEQDAKRQLRRQGRTRT